MRFQSEKKEQIPGQLSYQFVFIKLYFKSTHTHKIIKYMKYLEKDVTTISARWQNKTKQDQRRRTLHNHYAICIGFICNSIFLTMAFKPFHHLQPIISLAHFLLAKEKILEWWHHNILHKLFQNTNPVILVVSPYFPWFWVCIAFVNYNNRYCVCLLWEYQPFRSTLVHFRFLVMNFNFLCSVLWTTFVFSFCFSFRNYIVCPDVTTQSIPFLRRRAVDLPDICRLIVWPFIDLQFCLPLWYIF